MGTRARRLWVCGADAHVAPCLHEPRACLYLGGVNKVEPGAEHTHDALRMPRHSVGGISYLAHDRRIRVEHCWLPLPQHHIPFASLYAFGTGHAAGCAHQGTCRTFVSLKHGTLLRCSAGASGGHARDWLRRMRKRTGGHARRGDLTNDAQGARTTRCRVVPRCARCAFERVLP